MCWGVGKVRGDVRKGEMREEMWGSVLGTHTLTHFPTPPLFLSPHPSPSRQHTSLLTPYTFPQPYPHIFPYSSPHPSTLPYISHHSSPYLPLHPSTLPHSPHAFSHIFLHSLNYVAKLPCDDVTLINLTGLWKSSIKFSTTTRNLKSCFGVGNVNFRCMKVW